MKLPILIGSPYSLIELKARKERSGEFLDISTTSTNGASPGGLSLSSLSITQKPQPLPISVSSHAS